MYRLSYRNLGTRASLLVNHSVASGGVSAIRWYELDIGSGSPTVRQQGTYQPDLNYRWMGSAAMDKTGGIAIGYSLSSASIKPSIWYVYRAPGRPCSARSVARLRSSWGLAPRPVTTSPAGATTPR